MLCPRCGTPNRAQATICVRCNTALPLERSAPAAPSRRLDDDGGTTKSRVPLPSVAGLPDPRGMSGPAGGTKSSPWSPEVEGGTLGASVLDDLEEEVTVLKGLDALESPSQDSSQVIPRIDEVGFAGPTQAERAGRRPLARADTEEVDLSGGPVKSPLWEDIISATESPALERWGPLTEPKPKVPIAPSVRRPLIPERKETAQTMPVPVPTPTREPGPRPGDGPRGMPRFGPEVRSSPPAARAAPPPSPPAPIRPAAPSSGVPGLPSRPPAPSPALGRSPEVPRGLPPAPPRVEPPRPPFRAADPKTLPSMPPAKVPAEAKAIAPVPARATGTGGRPLPGPPAPSVAAPIGPAKSTPTGVRPPPSPTVTRPAIPAPSSKPQHPPLPSAPPAQRLPDPLAPRAQKIPTGAIRSSLPSTDDLLISNDTIRPDEEPPGEETRLGVLAVPLLASPPVQGAQHLKDAVGGRTIAAPGELAGLLDRPSLTNPPVLHVPEPAPAELSGVAADLSIPIAPPTVSQVERGLMAPLPTPAPEPVSERLPPPPRPLSLELTDRAESSLSSIPLPDPPPIMRGVTLAPQAETQPLPGAEPAPATGEEVGPGLRWRVSPAWRRVLAIGVDAALILAITTLLAIAGLFGDAAAEPSLDPDVFTNALGKGHLNLLFGFVLVLGLVYSITSHALLGRSLGKLACGLELVSTGTGQRPSVLRASWRGISTVLGLLMLGLGYAWLILDRRNRTLHDRLSGTTVVISSSRQELSGGA
ncbi:MAG: RDD family protein [Deltaproteobacteria bacterium]|nr:RDD family protein [Deltaproteobacteria bacterium]